MPQMLMPWGENLTSADYASLTARWITPELADAAGLRRIASNVGREMFSRKRGDLAGIIIPNVAPWDAGHIREYRERLDNPDLEYRADGSIRETNKYVQPSGRGNLIYFPVGTTTQQLQDKSFTVIISEGEFKAIALHRLALHKATALRFLAMAVAGVWNWRGTIGKAVGSNGDRRDVKGVIPDFERINWQSRRVIIAFDADSENNPKVRAARWQLSSALIERGATVGSLEWPLGG